MPPLLYRGVPGNTPRGQDALNGRVRPCGTSTDYSSHVMDDPVNADVTSWSTSERIARRFGDVILVIDMDEVLSRIVPNPLADRHGEEEVLVRGALDGVRRL